MSAKTSVPLVTDGYMGANLVSGAISVMPYPLLAVHIWLTGTPSGTLTFEVSNEENFLTDGYLMQNSTVPSLGLGNAITHWTNLKDVVTFPATTAFSEITITSGSPAQKMVILDLAGFKFLRLKYTASSGTGTLQARLVGKRNKSSNT